MDQAMEAPSTAHNLEDGEIDVTSTTALPQNPQKVCFFWYHQGACKRDPADPTRSAAKACPHKHSIDNGDVNVLVSHVASWMHKAPCGLPLCPWKDREWEKEKKMKASPAAGAVVDATVSGRGKKGRKRQSENDEEQARPAKRTKISQPKPPRSMQETDRKNRVRPVVRHRDDPAPSAKRRQKIYYEDETAARSPRNPSVSETPTQDDRETCFFWYHGNCARASDIRNNYTCTHRHALTEPPTMVQPPPRYTHARPCGLEWCPGDARKDDASEDRTPKNGATDRPQRPRTGKKTARKKQSVLTRGAIVEDEINGEDDCVSQIGSEVPSCGQPEPEVGTGEEWFLQGFPESLI